MAPGLAAGPDLNATIITVAAEGTRVELRGAPEGDWQPVRRDGRDGYITVQLIASGGEEAGRIPPPTRSAIAVTVTRVDDRRRSRDASSRANYRSVPDKGDHGEGRKLAL